MKYVTYCSKMFWKSIHILHFEKCTNVARFRTLLYIFCCCISWYHALILQLHSVLHIICINHIKDLQIAHDTSWYIIWTQYILWSVYIYILSCCFHIHWALIYIVINHIFLCSYCLSATLLHDRGSTIFFNGL